ncbi:hypothetical protein M3Y97_00569300 [Aphelenchoides bicaudatus]|nr:hypothetical protein M3Y97_00569300 [Aphelenchoides bicaudatus]
MIRRLGIVLLKCDSIPQRIVCAQPSFQVIPVRYVRTKQHDAGDSKENKSDHTDSSYSKSSDSAEERQKSGFNQANVKFNEVRAKRLGYYFVGSFVFAALCSYLLLRQGFIQGLPVTGESEIPFDVFVEKFLKAGEVRRITYLASNGVGMAELHDGAVIDGKPYEKPGVIFKYDRFVAGQPEMLQAEIRQIEQKLGISSRDAVPINNVSGFNAVRAIEFLIGSSILVFLAIAYARVGARKLAESAKNKGRPY